MKVAEYSSGWVRVGFTSTGNCIRGMKYLIGKAFCVILICLLYHTISHLSKDTNKLIVAALCKTKGCNKIKVVFAFHVVTTQLRLCPCVAGS